MAKAVKPESRPKGAADIPVAFIGLLSRFGIPGTFAVLLLYNATGDQYRAFIDRFILLKTIKSEPFIPYIVIFCISFVSLGTIFYLNRRNRLNTDRIAQLEKNLRALEDAVASSKIKKQK
jgi:hypothetical protein